MKIDKKSGFELAIEEKVQSRLECLSARHIVLQSVFSTEETLKSPPITESRGRVFEQALKSTDLLLPAGGFAAIMLDRSDVLPKHAMRIPIARWHRFRLAAEQARTALILLTQSPTTSSRAVSRSVVNLLASCPLVTAAKSHSLRVSVTRLQESATAMKPIPFTKNHPHTRNGRQNAVSRVR